MTPTKTRSNNTRPASFRLSSDKHTVQTRRALLVTLVRCYFHYRTSAVPAGVWVCVFDEPDETDHRYTDQHDLT